MEAVFEKIDRLVVAPRQHVDVRQVLESFRARERVLGREVHGQPGFPDRGIVLAAQGEIEGQVDAHLGGSTR